ncbi:DUF4893 domain-containing protein [Mesorhizobium sp. KR1-2]|uniref:DUF4893 domain-containing protein n=1 Tax=Mesorhizobium sp. KR1-2 TaxID=3156609 RepID=UPI0032B420A6
MLVLMCCLPSWQALATGEIERLIKPAERARLKQFDAIRKTALEQAHLSNSASDVATLDAVLARKPIFFSGFDMTGNWQCRVIKTDGTSPLVIADWGKCRVTDDGSGWRLEMLTGSQRTSGRFFTDSDTRLTYLGTRHFASEKPQRYPLGPGRDEVGYTFRTGTDEWRIELPARRYESAFDILEFKR